MAREHNGLLSMIYKPEVVFDDTLSIDALSQPSKIMEQNYIDLGLPSGRLWAAKNEPGYHQFDEAVKTFSDMLPSAEAWEELFNQCTRKWDEDCKGCVLTGPNGNTLFLPADGYKDFLRNKIRYIGSGFYWSSSPYGADDTRLVGVNSGYVDISQLCNRIDGFSVRLCQEP